MFKPCLEVPKKQTRRDTVSFDKHGAKKCILPPIAKPNDVAPADNRISQLQLSLSLHDIVEYFDELTLCQLSDSGFVICSLSCSDEIVAQAKASKTLSQTNGVITFSSENQQTFQTGESRFEDCESLLLSPFSVKKKVLDACFFTSLLYGCESWLEEKVSELEQLYMKGLNVYSVSDPKQAMT